MVELTILHCIYRFGNVRIPTRTPPDLDLYPKMDQKQMKVIDAEYSVRVGYWASKNNVKEYKMYATIIQMFDPNFMNNLKQALRAKSWPIEPTNWNYRT
jgi:hypothetical protein